MVPGSIPGTALFLAVNNIFNTKHNKFSFIIISDGILDYNSTCIGHSAVHSISSTFLCEQDNPPLCEINLLLCLVLGLFIHWSSPLGHLLCQTILTTNPSSIPYYYIHHSQFRHENYLEFSLLDFLCLVLACLASNDELFNVWTFHL